MQLSNEFQKQQNEYNDIKKRMQISNKVYADETSFQYWVKTNGSGCSGLHKIFYSLYARVEAIMYWKKYGKRIQQNCCLRLLEAYNYMSNANIQRCWAHLLRKSKVLKGFAGRHFHEN